MSINKLHWSIVAVALASNSHASLISVEIIAGANQHPDGLHDTWQVIAIFDDENDRLLGVNGMPVCFNTGGGELYNQALYAGLPFNDFPSAGALGGELWDSYVTTGAITFPSSTAFTEEWVGAIAGSEFCRDGGWYYTGDPPTVSTVDIIPDNKTFEVVVAQFTVDEGVGIHLEGNIIWLPSGSGKSTSTPFEVDNTTVPCPWDLDGSNTVSTQDLLLLLVAWGSDPGGPPDFNDDGIVNTSDLLELLANWGPCP